MSAIGNTAQKKLNPTRTATSDVGTKYEISVATLVAATLSNNKEIENYCVFTNIKEAKPFDDVVAKVWFKGDSTAYAFAMQLKHIGKGETIDVEKYLKGYNRIFNAGGLETIEKISIANIRFCYFCINRVHKADYYTIHGRNPTNEWQKSGLSFSNCHALTYAKPVNKTDEDFLNNFHLYLCQPNNNKIRDSIKTSCKMADVSAILNYVDGFFEKDVLWKRGLSKEVFETELLKIHLSDHIIPPANIIQLHDSQAAMWHKLTLQHNVTIVKAEKNIEKSLYGCFAQELNRLLNNSVNWSTYKTSPLDPNIISEFKKLFTAGVTDRIRHWIDPPTTLKALVVELWKCRELPLILRSDDNLPVLKSYAHLNKNFIIVTENVASELEEYIDYQLKVFAHISDIKNLELRDELLKNISVSLQGRKPIKLHSIVSRHEELTKTLSCSHLIHLIKTREAYLSKECLDGYHDMIFLIEDPTSTAEYNIMSINKVIGNVALRCSSEKITEYRKQIEDNPNLKNCEIYHCVTSSKNENFVLTKGNKSILKDFFVDQDEEDVYVLEGNPVPIIGPCLKIIQQNYIPRILRSAVVSKSIFDSETKGIYFFSGADVSYLEKEIRMIKAPNDVKFESKNIFIDVGDEDVEEYWEKASNLCPLLHIHIEGTNMNLRKCKNWEGLADHILYNGREIAEENVLTEVTDGITILTGEPGIGKSYLLQSIFNNHGMEKYILFYNLVDYSRVLEKNKLVPSNISLDFLLNQSKNKRYKELLSALFQRKDRILLLLDSFDEVLPIYKENVLHFIRNLAAANVQIIIASRTIANYILMGNFETRILKVDFLGANACREYVKNSRLNEEVLENVPDEFSRNPLYLNLLMTISEGNVNLERFSRFILFQKVIEIKMEQYFQRNFSNEHAPNKEYHLKPVRELHFQLALMRILGTDKVKELLELEDKSELTSELKLGVVLSIDKKGYPTFVHETFAEYLTADWIIINKTNDTAKKIYQEMRKQRKLYILDILCEHIELHKSVLTLNKEQMKMYATDRSHLERTDALGRMAIHVAAAHQPEPLWSAIDIIICGMCKFPINFTQPDSLMQWNWVQHSYQGHNIHYMLFENVSILVWEVYVNCIAQKLRIDSECVNLLSDYDVTRMYRLAVKRYSIDMIRDLLYIEDIKYNGIYPILAIGMLYLNNNRKMTPLHVGCIYGNVKVVENNQVHAVDSFGCTPLHYNVMNAEVCIDTTKMLLENGSKINIRNHYEKTAVHIAAHYGNVRITKLLLENGIRVSSTGKDMLDLLFLAVDALRYDASEKSSEIVGLILENGADVNGIDESGKTPLMLASEGGNADVGKILLQKGANINSATTDGKTPLMFASEGGSVFIAKTLLENGANVNSVTTDGKTPLMFAAQEGNTDVVKILLQKGANVNSTTTDGKTPLMFASKTDRLSILEILLENGAALTAQQ